MVKPLGSTRLRPVHSAMATHRISLLLLCALKPVTCKCVLLISFGRTTGGGPGAGARDDRWMTLTHLIPTMHAASSEATIITLAQVLTQIFKLHNAESHFPCNLQDKQELLPLVAWQRFSLLNLHSVLLSINDIQLLSTFLAPCICAGGAAAAAARPAGATGCHRRGVDGAGAAVARHTTPRHTARHRCPLSPGLIWLAPRIPTACQPAPRLAELPCCPSPQLAPRSHSCHYIIASTDCLLVCRRNVHAAGACHAAG